MKKSKKVLWFKEIYKHSINSVGGKETNPGEIYDDFPIPSGFVITSNTYFDMIHNTKIAFHQM